jgi:putative phosphoesterase
VPLCLRNSVPPILIGVISDTHGLVRPQVANIFSGVQLILHAGDVGGRKVLETLTAIAPTEAVYGNVDDPHDPALARERSVTLGGVTIHVSHGHELGRPTAELVAARYDADVLVFGHTHRAVVQKVNARLLKGRDSDRSVLVLNPGAAGPRRFDIQPTVALLRIVDGGADAEIISLA